MLPTRAAPCSRFSSRGSLNESTVSARRPDLVAARRSSFSWRIRVGASAIHDSHASLADLRVPSFEPRASLLHMPAKSTALCAIPAPTDRRWGRFTGSSRTPVCLVILTATARRTRVLAPNVFVARVLRALCVYSGRSRAVFPHVVRIDSKPVGARLGNRAVARECGVPRAPKHTSMVLGVRAVDPRVARSQGVTFVKKRMKSAHFGDFQSAWIALATRVPRRGAYRRAGVFRRMAIYAFASCGLGDRDPGSHDVLYALSATDRPLSPSLRELRAILSARAHDLGRGRRRPAI